MKSRIVLSAIALFAVVGGALAFKAAKFNSTPAFTRTTAYATHGTLYTAAGAFFYAPKPGVFITGDVVALSTVYSTTGTIAPGTITLTRVLGTETITVPRWTASLTTTNTTDVQ